MTWGLNARDTPGAAHRCACCNVAGSLSTRATSHRTSDRHRVCPHCDLAPDPLQGPWDGWLERWMREFRDDVTG